MRRRAGRIALWVLLFAGLLAASRPAAAQAAYAPAVAPYAVSDSGLTSGLYAAAGAAPAAPAPQLPGLTFPAAWAEAGAVETEAATAARVLPALTGTTFALGAGAFVTGVAIGLPIGLTIYRKLTADLGTPGTPGGYTLSWKYFASGLTSASASLNVFGVPDSGWALCADSGACYLQYNGAGNAFGLGAAVNTAAANVATATGATLYHQDPPSGFTWPDARNSRVYVLTAAQMSARVARTPSTAGEYATLPHATPYTAPNPMTSGDRTAARTALGAPVASRDGSGVYHDAAANVLTAAQVQAQLDLNCRIDASYCAGGANDPTATTLADNATVPNCAGLTYGACTAALTFAGFTATPTLQVLDFDHADMTKTADLVVHTNLTPGAFVPKTSPLVVTTNPADADMPRVIPEIEDGETGDHYRGRLLALGLLGFFLTTDNLDDATYDHLLGPDQAVRVWPRPGTRVHRGVASDPSTGTRVTIVVNPSSAPDVGTGTGTDTDPGEGGSGFAPPTLPGIDLEPLRAAGSAACDSFPLGIPCWAIATLHNLVGTSSAPHFNWQIPAIPTVLPAGYLMHFDMRASGMFGGLDGLMAFVRPLLLLMSFVGIGMWLARKASSNGATDGEEG